MQPEEYSASHQIFQMFLSLGGILVTLFCLSFIFKKFILKRTQVANEAGLVKVLERRALNPKSALYVVEVMGKTFLVGESPAGLVSLGQMEGNLEEFIPPPKPALQKLSFASILKNLKKASSK